VLCADEYADVEAIVGLCLGLFIDLRPPRIPQKR
jgi:hypothetical protein